MWLPKEIVEEFVEHSSNGFFKNFSETSKMSLKELLKIWEDDFFGKLPERFLKELPKKFKRNCRRSSWRNCRIISKQNCRKIYKKNAPEGDPRCSFQKSYKKINCQRKSLKKILRIPIANPRKTCSRIYLVFFSRLFLAIYFRAYSFF